MRVLLADKFPAHHLRRLSELGHDCALEPDLTSEELGSRIPGFQALIVRSTRVSAETIAAADDLEIVVRAGAGTNTIDTQAAAEKDIFVCNVPGKNAIAVAELVLGLLICIDRNIPDNVRDLRDSRWDKKRYSETRGLFGRTMGIVGIGAVGLEVAQRAKAFGLHIAVIRKAERSAEVSGRLYALGVTYVSDVNEMADVSDILSFHVPGTAQTRGMVGRELLERLAPGAILINTSRGDLVDETALIEAMDAKGIRAGLDVFANEPGSGLAQFDSRIAKHPNVYGTHHIGASTAQAQDAVADGVVEILTAFAAGKVLHCVNVKR